MMKIPAFFQNRSFRYGVPFLLIVLGGSFGLKEFAQLRYTFSKQRSFRDDVLKAGIEMKKPGEVTLESVYEDIKKMDIDNWEQVRGPRPWEQDGVEVK